MMGLWDRMFGNKSVVESLSDGVDKAWLTTEEGLDYQLKFMEMYSGFKVAQRYLAVLFSSTYCLGWSAIFIMAACGQDIKELKSLVFEGMGDIVFVVVGFYFLGGAGEGMINRYIKGKKEVDKKEAK